jgi:hypothetical protein
MVGRYDPREPRERWRWEEEREREDQVPVSEGRFARHGGDPQWGTGGLRADLRPSSAPPPPSGGGSSPRAPAVQGPYVGRGPKGYRRSDGRIHEDVCERFMAHGDLDASDVEVTVENGEVTLSGTVPTRGQKRLAEDIADVVVAVVEVHNRLRVQRPGSEPPAR